MKAKKDNRGGSRPGAGQPRKERKKKQVAVNLYPDDRQLLIDRFGTVQKAVDGFVGGLREGKE